MTEQERQKLKVKVASCPDCKGWITQAAYPMCEDNPLSRKDFVKHLRAGDNINIMTVGEGMLLPYCECYKLREAEKAAAKAAKKAAKQPDLFTSFSPKP